MRFSSLGFGGLWLVFVLYVVGLAPPAQPDQIALLRQLSSGNWSEINPLIVALFNLMGIWPMIYACVLFSDGRGQNIRAWPFAVGSFVAGAFALLPYFVLRQPNPQFQGPKDQLLRMLDSRWFAASLAITTLGLFSFGVSQGDWPDFIQQWQTNQFIHVMGLDFGLLSVCFVSIVGDDMKRRSVNQSTVFWGLSCIPMVGPLIYLCVRPPLQECDQDNADNVPTN